MRKTWWRALIGVLVFAAASYGLFLWLQPPGLPEGLLYGNGQIEATEVRVSAEVGGRVVESRLEEGRAVQAGEVLVRLDETDLKTRLEQAEAQVAAAGSGLARVSRELTSARHHLQTAQADLARYAKLREAGTVSAQAYDRAENQFQEARARMGALTEQLAETQASLDGARREVALLRSQLGKAEIHAPAAGTILNKAIEVGEYAAPGRTIAVLADLARLELKIYIPESEIAKIKLNDEARVAVDAFPGRYFPAHVVRVDQRAQFTPKDVHMPDERARLVFGVTLALDSPDGTLKPGMPADAWVRWRAEAPWPEQLTVPR